jgi:hypothetical protein
MKEREPDFEDSKIRSWLRRPEEHDLENLDPAHTAITIDEETEEIFESRAYRFASGAETFSFLLGALAETMGERLIEVPPEELAYYVTDIIESGGIKFLAKRHKEDDRITYIVVGISRYSRWLLDRQELVGKADYRQVVHKFEELFLSREILSPPVVVTLEEWRRYDEGGLLSG